MNKYLHDIHDQFVEKVGFLGTLFGFSKLFGQIYATLYLSPKPVGLEELMDILNVSKGSISVNIRELEKWGGCRKVWVRGDRRDFYEAETDFKQMANKRFVDALKRRLNTLQDITQPLEIISKSSQAGEQKEEDRELAQFYQHRLKHIDKTRKKLELLFAAIQKLI